MSSFQDVKLKLKNWWTDLNLKKTFKHFGLMITLCLYTFLGGLIFRYFESPTETEKIQLLTSMVLSQKEHLIESIKNDVPNIIYEIEKYENVLKEAFTGGIFKFENILIDTEEDNFERWTLLKSVFFSSTVLTTIGYGNIAPTTTGGRIFCILFSFIGIPLTLTVIADWGVLFASIVSFLANYLPSIPEKIKNVCILSKTSLYALAAICFLCIYLAAGAAIFVIWEDEWSFFDGFYFCFITMTTIGFGDLVPKKPKYMLLCTLYILVGLALTSTIIELVRRQYLQSWKQLQALSGPLAETLRKMAENAPGLDVPTFQNDLKKFLTVVTKKSGKKNKQQKEIEEAVEAVLRDITEKANTEQKQTALVKIFIYESSV